MSLMIFEWREDQEFGDFGWIAKDYPNFNITRGDTFAHDCLEHFPRGKRHGAAADELLALGARWWIRVDGGYWYQQRFLVTPEESWAQELENILRNLYFDPNDADSDGMPAKPRRMLTKDESFCTNDIMAEAIRLINQERKHDHDENGLVSEESPYIVRAEQWLRLGYAACRQRFKDASPSGIAWLTECMGEEANKYKHGDEGDLLYVRVHEKDQEFNFRHVSAYDRVDFH